MMKWTATVEKDEETGESVLQFPPGSIEGLGWEIGDTLEWKDLGDGTFSLSKKE